MENAYRPTVIRVWGKADNFDIEFKHMGGTKWQCDVPPDMKDGQYAVELRAMNEQFEQTYWTGFLYMCNGVCHVKFNFPDYMIWFSTGYDIVFERRCPHYG